MPYAHRPFGRNRVRRDLAAVSNVGTTTHPRALRGAAERSYIPFARLVALDTVAFSMKPLRKLAFVVNEQKAGAPALARELAAITRQNGVKYKLTSRFPIPRGCW